MAAVPGDVVCLAAGNYNQNVKFPKCGTASAWITLAALNPWAATVLSVNISNHSYIEVDGLHVTGGSHVGISANGGHHTRVMGNLVENMPGGGINLNLGDYRTITGNTVRGCSKGTSGNSSAISIWEPTAVDSASGRHNIISYNVLYNNADPVGGTDGNGIIFDDTNHTQSNHVAYLGGALIEENIAYANGGAGIKIFQSQNALVRNNTAYWNHNFNSNSFTWRGEIDNEDSSHNVFVNNIMVANPRFNSHNTAVCECGSSSDTWKNNITYNGVAGNISVNGSISSTSNLLGVNPLLAPDFSLLARSPARGAGSIAYGVPAANFVGIPIAGAGRVDIGAF